MPTGHTPETQAAGGAGRAGGAGQSGQSGQSGRGRPRMQEQADEIVAGVLAGAGPRVGSREYSTRRVALMTGLSQPLVSRSMRRIRGAAAGEEVPGHGDLRITAFVVGHPHITVEFAAGGVDVPGEKRAFERRATSLMAALWVSGAAAWATEGPVGEGDAAAGQNLAAEEVRVVWEPGQQSWQSFLDQVSRLLGSCARSVDAIPGELLAALSVRAGRGLHGLDWHRRRRRRDRYGDRPGDSPERFRDVSHRSGTDRNSDSDRAPVTTFPPPAAVRNSALQGPGHSVMSPAEQVAVALRKEIMDAGYRSGDRLTSTLLASHLGITQATARAALRRLADDGLLDSRGGVYWLPQVTGVDIVDLYAARLQVGSLLLRACAGRPRYRMLGVQTALRRLEAAGESGDVREVDQADLYFQQEVADASGLVQSARTFHALTLRLQMFISVLQLDYSPAVRRILADDRQIVAALVNGDAGRAVWTWRSKLDNAVRHMAATAGTRFDVRLWEQLTGA
jgi:DNA-binding GntR family transcriptional regulator